MQPSDDELRNFCKSIETFTPDCVVLPQKLHAWMVEHKQQLGSKRLIVLCETPQTPKSPATPSDSSAVPALASSDSASAPIAVSAASDSTAPHVEAAQLSGANGNGIHASDNVETFVGSCADCLRGLQSEHSMRSGVFQVLVCANAETTTSLLLLGAVDKFIVPGKQHNVARLLWLAEQ